MGVRVVPYGGSDFVTVELEFGPAPGGGAEFTLSDNSPGIVGYTTPVVLAPGDRFKEAAITGDALGTVILSAQLTKYGGAPKVGTIFDIDVSVMVLGAAVPDILSAEEDDTLSVPPIQSAEKEA